MLFQSFHPIVAALSEEGGLGVGRGSELAVGGGDGGPTKLGAGGSRGCGERRWFLSPVRERVQSGSHIYFFSFSVGADVCDLYKGLVSER
jgi:hypothetical protein